MSASHGACGPQRLRRTDRHAPTRRCAGLCFSEGRAADRVKSMLEAPAWRGASPAAPNCPEAVWTGRASRALRGCGPAGPWGERNIQRLPEPGRRVSSPESYASSRPCHSRKSMQLLRSSLCLSGDGSLDVGKPMRVRRCPPDWVTVRGHGFQFKGPFDESLACGLNVSLPPAPLQAGGSSQDHARSAPQPSERPTRRAWRFRRSSVIALPGAERGLGCS